MSDEQRNENYFDTKYVKNSLVDHILNTDNPKNPNFETNEVIDAGLRERIYTDYVTRYDLPEGYTYKSLKDIAESLLPETFKINETIAEEVVSIVSRRMYEFKMLIQILEEPLIATLVHRDELPNDASKRLAKDFHSRRKQEVVSFNFEKASRSDPEYYARYRARGFEARNAIDWETTGIFNAAVELLKSPEYIYPAGSKHAGKPNFKKMAAKLSGDFNIEITSRKLQQKFGYSGKKNEGSEQ